MEVLAEVALDEPEMDAAPNVTRDNLHVDFYFPVDRVAVLIDLDGRLAVPNALADYFSADWLAGITVLTLVSPDLYPTGHSTRELRRNKPLTVIRIARTRGRSPGRTVTPDRIDYER